MSYIHSSQRDELDVILVPNPTNYNHMAAIIGASTKGEGITDVVAPEPSLVASVGVVDTSPDSTSIRQSRSSYLKVASPKDKLPYDKLYVANSSELPTSMQLFEQENEEFPLPSSSSFCDCSA